jgi:hypothetical protein
MPLLSYYGYINQVMEQVVENFFTGLGIIGLIVLGLLLILYFWSIVWAYHDALKRGKPGWLVAVLVALLSWPIGLVVWLIFRPELSR